MTSPLSVSVTPCSETERPRPTASSRSCTLWALEPVKCCSRLPKFAGGTIRRSTETPLWVWARTPFSLGLPAAAISGWLARCSASAGGAGDLDLVGGRVLAQRRRQFLGDRLHLREQQAARSLPRLAEPFQRRED